MTPERCPWCESANTMAGTLIPGPPSHGPAFWPHSSWNVLLTTPEMVLPGRACLACGRYWTELDPVKVRRFIRERAGELASQEMDEIEHGPGRDLPDSGWGQDLGAKVAELDALARDRRDPALTRRFRELSGATWDDAIKASRRWHRLTRDEKLALFGWVPKEKPVKDDLQDPSL